MHKKAGFGIIDSLIALGILSSLIMGIVLYNNSSNEDKKARLLAIQTEAFAKVFINYMNQNYASLNNRASANTAVYINPNSMNGSWPTEVATINMYRQIPCVSIVKNTTSNKLEAIMFYVAKKNVAEKLKVIRNAALLLGSKGGVFEKGNDIRGNSGWSINASSLFLQGANQCGGYLPVNSIAVNLDLMPEWNHSLQPDVAINKLQDPHNGQLSLPGHLANTNTIKTNMYIAAGKGIILDNSNVANPIKLSISDNGEISHSPILSVGNNDLTTLTADTIQPKQQGEAGSACLSSELGKTIIDKGVKEQSLSKNLARSTLVCSNNSMLCSNDTNTCYLPTQPNIITYQNNNEGVQDNFGSFICPSSVPFATNVTTNSNNLLPVYHNKSLQCLQGKCSEYYTEEFDGPIYVIANQPDYQVTIQGNMGSYIQGVINGYKATIGYKLYKQIQVDYNAIFNDICNKFQEPNCNNSNIRTFTDQRTKLVYHWRNVGYQFGLQNLYNYDAMLDANLASKITSVTCSTTPLYVK